MKKILINKKTFLAIIYDFLCIYFAWYFSFLLRFNFLIPESYLKLLFDHLFFILFTKFIFFALFGLYKGIWRFASIKDLLRILMAVFITSIIFILGIYFFSPSIQIPRSIFILDSIILFLLMSAGRFFYRVTIEFLSNKINYATGKPIIVIGISKSAFSLIKELSNSTEWNVVGVLNTDSTTFGREIYGIKIYGGLENLSEIKDRFKVQHAVIAMPELAHHEIRGIHNYIKQFNLEVLVVPSVNDMLNMDYSISKIRKIDIEDLLGRDSVILDDSNLKKIIKKNVVMISGAGGSIGSELCYQIAKFEPRLLVCIDISEFALYQLQENITKNNIKIKFLFIIADVKDEVRLRNIVLKYKPTIFFHAAAYKHVPMMELNNVSEALFNNILGTYNAAKICQDLFVSKFVLISSDKAVNPTNVMGATKRLAEMICQGMQKKHGTHFIAVRFGNVLGSSGSVIPKFRQQILNGGPITVTHRKITRYFMSISEAAQLVIQSAILGKGGEVFVLDMGEPIRIAELAKDMIKLSGFNEGEISIKYTGLRPGEKLYEELLADNEKTIPSKHNKIRIAKVKGFQPDQIKKLLSWVKFSKNINENTLKKGLKKWVKEYSPDLSL